MAPRRPHVLCKRQLGFQLNGKAAKTNACKPIQERQLVKFHFGANLEGSLNCSDGAQMPVLCVGSLQEYSEIEPSLERATDQIFESAPLAGNPGWRPFVFSTIGDPALFAAGDKFENDLPAADQTGLSVVLGGGKDQPVPFQNFVRPALGEDLIAAIRIHFNRRSLASLRFPRDFNAHAVISPIEEGLCLCRLAAREQAHGTYDKDFNKAVK